jgi:SAM-dependent methyltransferase
MKSVGELLKDQKNSFDATVNLFTSMGYWDEETDIQIFKQVLDLTKRDGILIIHTVNRDYLIKNFQFRDVTYSEEGMVTILERRLDLENSRLFNTWKYYREEGKNLEHLGTIELNHRIYSLHELKKLVEKSGWSFQTCYGNYKMQPLTTDTFASIIIARK